MGVDSVFNEEQVVPGRICIVRCRRIDLKESSDCEQFLVLLASQDRQIDCAEIPQESPAADAVFNTLQGVNGGPEPRSKVDEIPRRRHYLERFKRL